MQDAVDCGLRLRGWANVLEIGRLLKAIRDVFGLVHTEAQEQALRILFEACKGNLYDSTGFELFCALPAMLKIRVGLLGLLTMWRLQDTLKQLLNVNSQVTSCANHSISRVQGNLAAVNFKADKT